MKNYFIIPMLNLQLFADGGAGAGAGDGGTAEGQGVTGAAALLQTKGEKNNPLTNVKYGIQEGASAAEVQKTATPDRNAEFEALIKGEYKDLYDQRMQETVRNRLKGAKENEARLKENESKLTALAPTLEMLGKKYGVDPSDIAALSKAIEDDDSYYEEEALEKGISVQQLKEMRKVQKENAILRQEKEARERNENARQLYNRWMTEAQSTKEVYPSFDMETEMKNQKFVDLLRSNIDVRTAFEVIHRDEII
jgi:membrane-bound lytic murein transglycosylase B